MSPSKRSVKRAAQAARPSSGRPLGGNAARAAAPSLPGRSRAPFLVAIGLSAFLLFTLELLAGRLLLPVFGGTPAVWTTTLCFFTAVLFLGYLYAHVVATRLGTRQGGAIHLVVAVVAVVATFFGPKDIAALRDPGLPEALNVLYAQALIAGPAAFLLATTTPLLSAWYAGRRRDPWWLYAVSNGASFVGLLIYPFLIEPLIGLSAERSLLAMGVALFAAALVAVVASGWRPGSGVMAEPPSAAVNASASAKSSAPPASAPPPPRLTLRRQAIWLFAAFVPAGLLAATTNFITTDLIAAPLLWVGPLAIYLLSFVVAFTDRGRRAIPRLERLAPAAATLLWIPWLASSSNWAVSALLLVELGAFGILAVTIHGRLAMDRPDERQLTRFYLVIAAGGVLATTFVALIAPLIFPAIWEYPILIVAALVALVVLPGSSTRDDTLSLRGVAGGVIGRVLPYAVLAALLLGLVARMNAAGAGQALGFIGVGALLLAISVRPIILPAATAGAILVLAITTQGGQLAEQRTFFGVIKIATDGVVNAEYAGTTIHGAQFLDEGRRKEPTTYYVRSGPLGSAFEDLRARMGGARVGVVGLGAGTTLAYERPGDAFTVFEIDPAVIALARDRRYFTYLPDAASQPKIVLGDARLSLAQSPAGSFDLIVLDAFSSDAVPAHLLTAEAMTIYARTLRPGGVILFHLSNRYYDLARPVVATAESIGLGALALRYTPDQPTTQATGALGSIWVVAGASADVERFRARGWTAVAPGTVLTDDFPDLLRSLQITSL
jgi:SAM-dependent methyltransferase